MGEEGVQKRARDAALRHAAGVKGEWRRRGCLTNVTDFCLLVRRSRVQFQRDVLIPSWPSLEFSLEGDHGVKS